jgi:hypothetical protein
MSSMTPYTVDVTAIGGGGTTFTLDVVQTSNTDTTTNLNLSTATTFPTEVPITGTTEIAGTNYTIVGNGIQCNFDGLVKISANVHLFSTDPRAAIQLRARLNGTAFGPVGSSGYIRDATGHQESSLHLCVWTQVTSGQIISLGTRRESTQAGSVTMALSGSSNLMVERYFNV